MHMHTCTVLATDLPNEEVPTRVEERNEERYIASLYYLESEPHQREIHFVVNLDNEDHKTVRDNLFHQLQFIP